MIPVSEACTAYRAHITSSANTTNFKVELRILTAIALISKSSDGHTVYSQRVDGTSRSQKETMAGLCKSAGLLRLRVDNKEKLAAASHGSTAADLSKAIPRNFQ